MNWNIAMSTGSCTEQPIAQSLSTLHAAGVTAVELGTPPRHFDPWSHAEVASVGAQLGTLGMRAVSLHAPFGPGLDLTDPDRHHRHAALGAILASASALHELGGSRIIVHASDVPRANQDVGARLSLAVSSLRVLARVCRQMGIQLVVETPLPHLIGGSPDELASVICELDPSVKVCFDTSHATLGHNWDGFMDRLGSRLVHVHANDHRGRFDEHLPPGDGVIDWRHIADSLVRIRFQGWIVLELACPAAQAPDYFSRALRQFRGLVER